MGTPPTVDELLAAEPRLRELLAEVLAFDRHDAPADFCAVAAWRGPGGLDARLRELVGPDRRGPRHAVLSTHLAYHVAADYLAALVPPCRGRCCGRDGADSRRHGAAGRKRSDEEEE